jgi:hypothetical protein
VDYRALFTIGASNSVSRLHERFFIRRGGNCGKGNMKSICLVAVIAVGIVTHAYSQQQTPPTPPKTKLEAFTGEVGVVVIKGYSDIGKVKGSGNVSVTAMSFKNARTGDETKGLVLEVEEPGSSYRASPNRSYLDYDEVSGLIEGIDYIAKTDETSTPYPFYEGKYSTRGDFSLTVFNDSSGKKSVAVNSSRYGSHSAYLTMDQLKELRHLITKGRDILDDPRAAKVRTVAPTPAVTSSTTSSAAKPSVPTAPPRSQVTPTPAPQIKPAPQPLNTSPSAR